MYKHRSDSITRYETVAAQDEHRRAAAADRRFKGDMSLVGPRRPAVQERNFRPDHFEGPGALPGSRAMASRRVRVPPFGEALDIDVAYAAAGRSDSFSACSFGRPRPAHATTKKRRYSPPARPIRVDQGRRSREGRGGRSRLEPDLVRDLNDVPDATSSRSGRRQEALEKSASGTPRQDNRGLEAVLADQGHRSGGHRHSRLVPPSVGVDHAQGSTSHREAARRLLWPRRAT